MSKGKGHRKTVLSTSRFWELCCIHRWFLGFGLHLGQQDGEKQEERAREDYCVYKTKLHLYIYIHISFSVFVLYMIICV